MASRGSSHLQRLDYECVPFRCRRCHDYGHTLSKCPKPYQGQKGKAESLQNKNFLASQVGAESNSP
jgi:hypothetical protein